MKKRNLFMGSVVLLAILPTVIMAADEFAVKAGRTDLDYIWTLIVGTLVFFLKSKKIL